MTYKELLELAAKAAGINLSQWVGKGCWMDEPDEEGFQIAAPDFGRWNPLTDDGDALRLAVKLEMELWFGCGGVNALGMDVDIEEDYNTDPYAATRRAIVRAAAEIGRVL